MSKKKDAFILYRLVMMRILKNNLKSIKLLFIVVSLLLVSCSGTSHHIDIDTSGDSTFPQISNTQKEYREETTLNILNPYWNSTDYKEIDEWNSYINKKYNIDLNMKCILNSPIEFLKDNEGLNYILYLNNPTLKRVNINMDFKYYCNPDFAYDLSEFYDKYGWYKFIESDLIEKVSINEKPYAIPLVTKIYAIPRYYRKDYLEDFDMDIPQTINEFYEYLVRAKTGVDTNEEFYPMFIKAWGIVPGLNDVFKAFGVYASEYHNQFNAYNPILDSYENAAFSDSDQLMQSMLYIRTLQQEGLMAIYGENQHTTISSDDEILTKYMFKYDLTDTNMALATERRFVYNEEKYDFYKNQIPSYESVEGYYLTGKNSKHVMEVVENIDFYIFPNTIDNINGTVDLFNKILIDPKYVYDFKYGIENKDYIVYEDKVVSIQPEYGELVNLNMLEPLVTTDDSTLTIFNTPESLKYDFNIFREKFSLLSGSSANRLENGGTQYADYMFYTEIALEDSINEYKKDFLKNGMAEIIDEFNEILGKTTHYNYID